MLNEGFPAGGDYLCPHFEQMSIVWSLHDDEQRATNPREPTYARSDSNNSSALTTVESHSRASPAVNSVLD